ncbi:MAG: phosphate--nucleotide phosphotransferase [Opitutia bacterium Tous-C1TDCM]|nr:MAG: phosphate--nucleotide phosphotransferase [Opitutae bacterium Tous-C1TDCM]
MKINPQNYRVPAGTTVDLAQWPTRGPELYRSKKDYKKTMEAQVESLSDLQRIHYASNRYALLLIFQAMDTAGKDGAIRNVMSGVDPQGCAVHSFKQPSAEELEHDFLWRTQRRLPERGQIGIFNRSYYEEVLIVRVHPELLRAQGLSGDETVRRALWEERYASIRDSEAHLHRSGTRILKFFLHLSKDEQRARLLARIDEPAKNWKFSLADVEERTHWDDYQQAYAAALGATSTAESPWFVVPADDKKSARLIVSEIILAAWRGLKLAYPETTAKRRQELQQIRRRLEK